MQHDIDQAADDHAEGKSAVVEPPKKETKPLDKALLLRLVIGAVVAALFVTFAIQNVASVDVKFLAWEFKMRRFLLMVCSAVIGAVLWSIVSAMDRRRKRRSNK